MRKLNILVLICCSAAVFSQSNTAVTSGSAGKCSVWGYPYTLYNNSDAVQYINNGVTVTVDQERHISKIAFIGSGAMDMNGTNGVSFSGNGTETTCKWDIASSYSGTISQAILYQLANVFTAPYTGNYIWNRGSGWGGSTTGVYNAGAIGLDKNDILIPGDYIFYDSRNGVSCNSPVYLGGPYWNSSFSMTLSSGDKLGYSVGTGSSPVSTCQAASFSYTIGSATVYYDN